MPRYDCQEPTQATRLVDPDPMRRTMPRSSPCPLRRHLLTLAFGLLATGFVGLGVGCHATPRRHPAELVLLGANVHTFSPHASGEAIAIFRGQIEAVGTNDEIRSWIGPDTQVVDLLGATVLPGFTDSHMHLSGVGAELMTLNLKGTDSLQELLARVSERVQATEPGEWIVGRGWIESEWDPPVFPTRQDLDLVADDRPIWLRRVDGHAAVANSFALQVGGIDRDTVAPPGGEIVKDARGEPTGMIVDRAMIFIDRKAPRDDDATLRRQLIEGARQYVARGWTSVQIAGVDGEELRLIEELVESGEIPLRVYAAVYGPGDDADRLLTEGPRGLDPKSRFTVRTIKVSYDGALGSGGAALLEPYADPDIDGRGLLNDHFDPDMRRMLERALRRGIQVEVHAIGDRANRHVLDLYEAALAAVPPAERAVADPRFRIEHAQILHADDIPRFAGLGVIPSMQASHATTDLHFALDRLGPERLAGAYAWRSLRETGAIIAGGSDAPVETGDPRFELYAATTRRDLKGRQGNHWHPEQVLTREEAIRSLTEWPAYAAFQESWRGAIAPGMAADLTVLDRDPLRVPLDDLPRLSVVMTIVGGDVVYDPNRRINSTVARLHSDREGN